MNNTMLALKQQLKQIADLILDKNDVLYFDYPLHLNVGDLLIYAGTEQFFKDYQINVRLRRCLQDFSLAEAKKYITPNTTLICHGGGNFGDLYPSIQRLREDIVKTFPNNRIIVMPQTAYFSNEIAMKQSSAIFKAHKDCHLFARDVTTYQLMKEHFSKNTVLSPDMAHQLYGKLATKAESSAKQSENVLYFLRKDIEKSHLEQQIRATLSTHSAIKDWDDILTDKDHQFELWMSRFANIANKFGLNFVKNIINQMWYKRSLEIIERVRKIFISYDLVVTSRLHGHIFSCLLELPNEVCDNAYGKNLGYYNQWTNPIEFSKPYQQ
ncbi:polysaccharide pyruvyl transferase family protein [Mannheimia sp. AT1]|uniref:Polysaccharide pyruvyl transferase family protein n=1 Tax=Mannheimia cairinae TaxID=3025936 RepID=A0ABT5MMY0_9PAST|nr:polysaccharide pyruvyl transferase family protein [Mannheimia cairinae]MDD0823534.1 polysaccharide pyruvyl transferase family protein [Mannheimia cairinae]MDD0826747.1 polysaccharide pyruvyl transferase family protein [Mannheimia cairinae]